jgi:hypothetical protein
MDNFHPGFDLQESAFRMILILMGAWCSKDPGQGADTFPVEVSA